MSTRTCPVLASYHRRLSSSVAWPGIRRAHIDDADRFNARLRRLNPEQDTEPRRSREKSWRRRPMRLCRICEEYPSFSRRRTYRRARTEAVEQNTSLSAWLGAFSSNWHRERTSLLDSISHDVNRDSKARPRRSSSRPVARRRRSGAARVLSSTPNFRQSSRRASGQAALRSERAGNPHAPPTASCCRLAAWRFNSLSRENTSPRSPPCWR
jgi:hypothetical protein